MKLELKNITYKINNKVILKDINCAFENGLYVLLGLNGSGKTTLIEIIATLKKPSSGEIVYDNTLVEKNPILFRRYLGYMPQNQGLIQEFDVVENLTYFGLLKGCEKKSLSIFIQKILKEFNLEYYKNQKIRNLSGGLKQKVMLILSLLNNPKVLILDEPINNLDEVERKNVYSFLKEISKTCIVILSTHLIEEITAFSDYKIFIKEGLISKEKI